MSGPIRVVGGAEGPGVRNDHHPAARSGRLDLAGLGFDAFRDQPLDEATLRCLRYMHDVEHHTVCYLRDILVTPAHQDPEVTTFLTTWAYEEHWHGEAIGDVLARHGEGANAQRVAPLRGGLGVRDRLAPLVHGVASALVGRDYTALQMAWGALNELTTQAGYARLAAQAQHPVLTDLLGRIMRQEGRHIAFYRGQAQRCLETSRRARTLTRFALERRWRPVGSDVMPGEEVAFLVRHLFADDEGRRAAARIDRQMDRLPGLDGLALVDGAVQRLAT